MNLGFPDVCGTPAGPAVVPIPYPNIAMNAQAVPFSPNVMVSYMNALNVGSMIPLTSGDEGGVAHPMIKGPGKYTMGNPIVKVNFMPAINLCCPTTGNNMNNPLGAVLVPSITNVFFTHARAPAVGPLDGAALHALAESMEGAEVESAVRGNALGEGAPDEEVLGIDVQAEDALGVIRVPVFRFDTATRVDNALRQLIRARGTRSPEGPRTIVLDLRGNPGGELRAGLRVLELWLPEGTVLCRVVEADGDVTVHKSRAEGTSDLPLVVWIDRHTGSAAELVAAVLQHHRRARIVGERSAGKATIESVVPHEGGSSYAQVGRWQLPDGSSIQGRGVVPEAVAIAASAT